MNQVNNC